MTQDYPEFREYKATDPGISEEELAAEIEGESEEWHGVSPDS